MTIQTESTRCHFHKWHAFVDNRDGLPARSRLSVHSTFTCKAARDAIPQRETVTSRLDAIPQRETVIASACKAGAHGELAGRPAASRVEGIRDSETGTSTRAEHKCRPAKRSALQQSTSVTLLGSAPDVVMPLEEPDRGGPRVVALGQSDAHVANADGRRCNFERLAHTACQSGRDSLPDVQDNRKHPIGRPDDGNASACWLR